MAAAPAPQAKLELTPNQAPQAKKGKAFVILPPWTGSSLRSWANLRFINPGAGLHPANQVWMRPNHDSTTLGDLKASSQILRNSCSARFREIKDISSGEMDVPEEPKD